jgi:heptosyltransferase II
MEIKKPNKIIVRMPNWLGDCVMATPILEDIFNHWPESSLTVMCQGPVASLLESSPYVSDILKIEKGREGWLHKNLYKKKIIDLLRNGNYDLALLLTNSFSSAWMFWRARIKQRVGFKNDGRSLLLTHNVSFPKNKESQHLIYTYKELLIPLGIQKTETAPKLFTTPHDTHHCEKLLQKFKITQDTILIGINATATYGPAKCWPPEKFRSLTKKLLDENKNNSIVYLGDSSSKSEISKIIEGFSSRVVSLAGMTTLKELVSIIKRCNLFITNDSGPMHIAAACKTPLVAIFGSTSDIVTPPYKHGCVIHKHVSCSPCYKRVCPIDFPCMTSISVEEVYNAALKEL